MSIGTTKKWTWWLLGKTVKASVCWVLPVKTAITFLGLSLLSFLVYGETATQRTLLITITIWLSLEIDIWLKVIAPIPRQRFNICLQITWSSFIQYQITIQRLCVFKLEPQEQRNLYSFLTCYHHRMCANTHVGYLIYLVE